jgi:hypothetical protein
VNRGSAISGVVTADPLMCLSSSLSAPLRPSWASLRCCALVSQLLFFDASSFLIAANRDVKTIRALLLDSEPDAQFFSQPSLCSLAPISPSLVSLEKCSRRVLARSICDHAASEQREIQKRGEAL